MSVKTQLRNLSQRINPKFLFAVAMAMIITATCAFYIGYGRGYDNGFITGQNDAKQSAQTAISTNSPALPALRETYLGYESDPNSMANLIVAADGRLLPVTGAALDEHTDDGYTDKMLSYTTEFQTVREFYESFGITIGEQSEYPGWYYCDLPEGWSVSYDSSPNASRDESVHFHDAAGNRPFYLITSKSEQNQFAHLTGWRTLTKADLYSATPTVPQGNTTGGPTDQP